MDSICGSRDAMAVSIGLVAADATSLKEPRLSQMTQLVETFDSLAPLKEGLRAHVLAQAVRVAALTQRSASLPHGPKGIWVDLLRLHSNPESSESTSPPGASHWPSLSRSDHLSPASFLARMCSDAEDSAITSPSAAVSSAPLEPTARRRRRLRRKRCPPRLESPSSPQQLAEVSQSGACFAPSGQGGLKTINLEGTDSCTMDCKAFLPGASERRIETAEAVKSSSKEFKTAFISVLPGREIERLAPKLTGDPQVFFCFPFERRDCYSFCGL